MGCYIAPTAAAIMHFFMRKYKPSFKGKYHKWLNQLFIGGAIFGIVDHWWNGELFLFGEHLLLDLALGVTITTIILVIWCFMVIFDRISHKQTLTAKS